MKKQTLKRKTTRVKPKHTTNFSAGGVKYSKSKANKLKKAQIMLDIRTQLFNIVILQLHYNYMKTDKTYFKFFAKYTGIKERSLRMVLNKTYDGSIPEILNMVQRAGLVLDIKYVNNK